MTGSDQKEARILAAFLQCRAYLARMVGRIVRRPYVEDVLQETFLRCFEASSRMDIRHPQAFMTKVATNIALNHIAKADNKLENRVATFPDSAVGPVTGSLEDEVDIEEKYSLFCRAVRRLPPQCREAFTLKKVYGMSRKEVARHMGITESTAQKHIAKGTLMCAEFMDAMHSSAAHGAQQSISVHTRARRDHE